MPDFLKSPENPFCSPTIAFAHQSQLKNTCRNHHICQHNYAPLKKYRIPLWYHEVKLNSAIPHALKRHSE
jgi:hypothetical protein